MTSDDLAHARFHVGFDKLFGAQPALRKEQPIEGARRSRLEKLFVTKALREEYVQAEKHAQVLMLMEVTLEKMVAPRRLEKSAAVAMK